MIHEYTRIDTQSGNVEVLPFDVSLQDRLNYSTYEGAKQIKFETVNSWNRVSCLGNRRFFYYVVC
jgi:hypothetical protein